MMKGSLTSVILLVACLQLAAGASIFSLIGSSLGNLVTEQEEVAYTLVNTAKGYEERTYPGQVWVCTLHRGELTSAAQQTAFLALFDYLDGSNNQTLSMDMAVPVSVLAPADPATRKYEACFYPGSAHQEGTPQPTSPALYLKQWPQLTVFTRRFGGYADTEEEWRTETAGLLRVLQVAQEPVLTEQYYWNAYDSPIKFWSRRNEVWVLKKE